MTTKITVEPAADKTVRITITDRGYTTTDTEHGSVQTTNHSSQTIVLNPGSATWVGYVHDNKTVEVREIDTSSTFIG